MVRLRGISPGTLKAVSGIGFLLAFGYMISTQLMGALNMRWEIEAQGIRGIEPVDQYAIALFFSNSLPSYLQGGSCSFTSFKDLADRVYSDELSYQDACNELKTCYDGLKELVEDIKGMPGIKELLEKRGFIRLNPRAVEIAEGVSSQCQGVLTSPITGTLMANGLFSMVALMYYGCNWVVSSIDLYELDENRFYGIMAVKGFWDSSKGYERCEFFVKDDEGNSLGYVPVDQGWMYDVTNPSKEILYSIEIGEYRGEK